MPEKTTCTCVNPDTKCPSGWNSGNCSSVFVCKTISTCYDNCEAHAFEVDYSQLTDAGIDTNDITNKKNKINTGETIKAEHFEILGKYLSKVADRISVDEDYTNPSINTGDKILSSHAKDAKDFLQKIASYSGINAADALLTLNNLSFEVGDKIKAKELKDYLDMISEVAMACRCVSDAYNKCDDQCACDCHY
jgi:hypothetical protein